jgi:hypothetical protein
MTELQIVQQVYPKWRHAGDASTLLWEGTAFPCCGIRYAQKQLRDYYGWGCVGGWQRRIWRKFALKQREWDALMRQMSEELQRQDERGK